MSKEDKKTITEDDKIEELDSVTPLGDVEENQDYSKENLILTL